MRLACIFLPILALPAVGQSPFRVDLPNDLPDAFDVAVERSGVPMVLRLERRSVRAAGFVLLVYRADGSLEPVPPPPPATYRGVVDGDPGSTVVASLSPRGLSALFSGGSSSGGSSSMKLPDLLEQYNVSGKLAEMGLGAQYELAKIGVKCLGEHGAGRARWCRSAWPHRAWPGTACRWTSSASRR